MLGNLISRRSARLLCAGVVELNERARDTARCTDVRCKAPKKGEEEEFFPRRYAVPLAHLL